MMLSVAFNDKRPLLDYGTDPGIPVLWCIWGDSRAFPAYAARVPFGEAIYLAP
jgi:hypothetical protein